MAKYTVMTDTTACAKFVIEADTPQEAEDKAWDFIDKLSTGKEG